MRNLSDFFVCFMIMIDYCNSRLNYYSKVLSASVNRLDLAKLGDLAQGKPVSHRKYIHVLKIDCLRFFKIIIT